MADGPQLEDPGVIAQRMMGAGKSGGDQDKDDIFEKTSRIISRILGIRLNTLFNVGILANFKLAQSSFDKPINQGAGGLNVRGGAGTNFIAKSLQLDSIKDFSKIAKPAIESEFKGGFPVESMSYASLGNLSPPDSGGGGRGSIGLG